MLRIVPHYRALARNHDFRTLWVGQTISELGSRMGLFVFPLLGYATTGSTLWAAATGAAHLGGLSASVLPAGVLADRVDRRRLLRAASVVGALGQGSLAVALALGAATLPHLLLAALATGVAAGVFLPAETSALRTVVPREQLPTALSQNQARTQLADLVGGPLGAALFGLGRAVPVAVDGLTHVVAWLMLGRLRTDLAPEPRSGPATSAWSDLRAGAGYVVRHPLLRTLSVWAFTSNLVGNALFTVVLLRMIASDVPAITIGLVEAVAAGAGIVGAVLAPWVVERVPTGWLTVAVAWSPVPLVVPMALDPSPVVACVALSLVVALNPAGNAGIGAYRLAVVPGPMVARVQAVTQFVALSSLPLAPLTAGVLLHALGGTAGVLVAGGLCGLSALLPTLGGGVLGVPRPDRWDTTEAAAATAAVAEPAAA